ncbi:MAG TPA: imidazole glycerol phosphate synthase subunit HisH [Clostridia bacterium]|nr:imidazole glycerol phosphate synthase subunit HisH [Clostridia bacterium]
MIAIIDYGVGNLFSLSGSLNYLGLENKITSDYQDIKNADHIILPGVGAFKDAIEKLQASGLVDVIIKEVSRGKPLLGICLGMQLLFNKSYEYGVHNGLGLIDGEIRPIIDDLKQKLKVPHMGWNKLELKKSSRLFKYTKDSSYVYYVHSFYAKNCASSVIATSEYDIEITGVVENGNVFGTQFHPEKSGEVGLRILKAFAEIGG